MSSVTWWATQANQLSHQTTARKAVLLYLLTAIPGNISNTEKPEITLHYITIVCECPCIMSASQISPKQD